MRILFLHKNFPGQFRHLAEAMAQDERHLVAFATARHQGEIPGVWKLLFRDSFKASEATHPANQSTEVAIRVGQEVARLADRLRMEQFVPDVIFGHSGWGPTLLMKDMFPRAKLIGYFEWFYRARSPLYDFDPSRPLSPPAIAHTRVRNVPILTDLAACDAGFSPTQWQRDQFPREFHGKIKVLHDGVQSDVYAPWEYGRRPLRLPRIGLDLTGAREIVTYVARGMDPVRGFPEFMKTVERLQRRRPQTHFVVAAQDRIAYGDPRPDGRSYKEALLEELDLDLSRLHFTGLLPENEYLQLLQASSVHVFLTWPFVLSWSVVEAMSTGCLVVGSDTEPVREIIRDGENGLLVDFFDIDAIAARIEEALDHPREMKSIRASARETVLQKYDLEVLRPQHLAWLEEEVLA